MAFDSKAMSNTDNDSKPPALPTNETQPGPRPLSTTGPHNLCPRTKLCLTETVAALWKKTRTSSRSPSPTAASQSSPPLSPSHPKAKRIRWDPDVQDNERPASSSRHHVPPVNKLDCLYNQISNSRDRLFFISHEPLQSSRPQWYLVQIQLDKTDRR